MVISPSLLQRRGVTLEVPSGLLPVAIRDWPFEVSSVEFSSEVPCSTVKISKRLQRGKISSFTAGKMGLSNKFGDWGVLTFYKKTGASGKVIHRSASRIDTQTVIQSREHFWESYGPAVCFSTVAGR